MEFGTLFGARKGAKWLPRFGGPVFPPPVDTRFPWPMRSKAVLAGALVLSLG